jgi:hypothetical protein
MYLTADNVNFKADWFLLLNNGHIFYRNYISCENCCY